MKRRKMEELIEKRLEQYFGKGSIGGEQRYLASEILEVIENAGMLPPYSKKKDLGCECGCKGRCEIQHNWDDK